MNTDELRLKVNELRIAIIDMIFNAQSGHPGGSLSAIDILTVLYNNFMKHNPKNT
ncbi:transketolase, partial [candidate division WOR-3 bacterium]|nr:transketolase [candidate division WOR-3 bacterium]